MIHSILFVCTANRFRSPIAAACFTQETDHHGQKEAFQASSAGTWTTTGQPATDDAIQSAKKHHLDLSLHRSRLVSDELLSQADLVIPMSSGQVESLRMEFLKYRDRIILLSEAAGAPPFDIPDPYLSDNEPEEIADEIVKLIHKGYDNIVHMAVIIRNHSDFNPFQR